MPLYQFTNEIGEEVEVHFGMDEAPEIGTTIEHEGQKLCRIVSEQSGIVREYRHVSHSLPRVNPADPYWPNYNSKGQPVFTSKKQVQECQARIRGLGGKGFTWE